MQTYLNRSDDIWWWACSKFGTEIVGERIEWDSTDPPPETDAQNTPPQYRRPGQIRVRNASTHWHPIDAEAREEKAKAFEKMWSRAVFELYNIAHTKEFERVYLAARLGKIDRKIFVRKMFVIEFKSVQLTRKWYVEVFLPHATKYNLTTDPNYWFCCGWWGTPEDVFKCFTDKTAYPWEPYGTYYLDLTGKTKSQRTMLDNMR